MERNKVRIIRSRQTSEEKRTARAVYPWHKMGVKDKLILKTHNPVKTQRAVAASAGYYRRRYNSEFRVVTHTIERDYTGLNVVEILRVK